MLKVAESERFGPILTDGEGRSLYIYTNDTVGPSGSVSNCTGACTRNWPPLLADGELKAGEGVDAGLLGTIEREDGTTQVTYNGWPLYRFARDRNPGDVRGQRLGGAFFLISPEGTPVEEERQRVVEVDPATLSALMSNGEQIFSSRCAACHGNRGQGLVGPAFAGNSALARTDYVVPMILNGFVEHGMPPWRDVLSDWEIASVATFIRNSWSNEFGPVTEEEVSAMR
ncbi:MAG: c-type cytochrome [Firmicutes bacterium]|nr:c-type cytochrome [Bacillota bacterium]